MTSPSLSSETIARLDMIVESERAVRNLPGVALAVTDAVGLVHRAAHGVADLRSGTPATDETLFEIGSISKSFTALLIAQDAAAGRLDLHAPLTDRLPWFEVRAQHDHPIAAHHLLGHTAGLVQGAEAGPEARPEVWALRDTPAIAEPGTWFHYSNVGYKALGVTLEDLHGKPFGELLAARVLRPLGLEQTEPLITSALRPRLAVGHEALLDDRPLAPGGPLAPATWLETGTADGSIAATATDLAAYLRAWLTPGPVITAELITMMTVPGPPADGDDVRYGYGWDLLTLDGHRCLAHGGGMVGYTSHVVADLDAGLGVAVLSNGPGGAAPIALAALGAVRADRAGEPLPPFAAWDPTRIADAADLTGSYRSPRRELVLRADDERVVTGAGTVLQRLDDDVLLGSDGELDRFTLGVQRADGGVRALTYGPERLDRRDGADGETAGTGVDVDDPRVGHWRAHNPWFTNFRTFVRDGQLILAAPGGTEAPGGEQRLVELEDAAYRVGADPRLPERLRFSMELGGRPQQATLDGCAYHRTFTD